ncbi:MAG TPA: transglutaminase domain-containing protein [Chitinophagaceae bacterium]|nr:transglutaminase domain-containing protein [Chitinophagaceae bacterium]
MKIILIIAATVCYQSATGQGIVENLAKELTQSCQTDREKVTRIFRWITDNISYKTKAYRIPVIGAQSRRFANGDFDEDTASLKPLNERVAENVISSRFAVCDGYARLFTSLCDYAGIKSEIIIGYANNGSEKPGSKFGVNHFWNAVFFDTKWHLVDAAWASGYVIPGKEEFVRDYDDKYFLCAPEVFVKDHFPENPYWTLLVNSVVPGEFKHSPFHQKSFIKYNITSYLPSNGIIEAELGDVIKLGLTTSDVARDKMISPDICEDPLFCSPSQSSIFLTPEEKDPDLSGVYTYVLKVENPGIEWVYLLYNNDMVLRYKVNIKKKRTGS